MSRAAPLIAWSLWTVSLIGTIVEIAFFLKTQEGGMLGTPIVASLYALVILAFPTVGAIIASRQKGNLIGWLLCAMGPAAVVQLGLPVYAQWAVSLASERPAGAFAAWLAQWTYLPSFALFATVLLLFPNGRLPSRRWTPALLIVVGTAALGTLGYALLPELQIQGSEGLRNPYGMDSEIPQLAAMVGDVLFTVVGIPVAALSLIIRLRRARGQERQQLKWLAYAGVVAAGGAIIGSFYYGTQPAMLLSVLSFLGIPAGLGIAILHYRLYDIDVLINRTAVYGGTSATLALTFFAGIIALQALLRPLTSGSELAIAASTLVSFALFQPIRRRIQNAVDRRFDRARYDAVPMLDTFADRVRDEVDLDALRADLLAAVQQTMAPAHVSLWLRPRAR